MTSSDCRGAGQEDDNRDGGDNGTGVCGGGGGQSLPIIMTTRCRMPRSPSREKDFVATLSSGGRTNAAQQEPYPAATVLNRTVNNCNSATTSGTAFPKTFFKRMSQDVTKSEWFEEENDLIKSCGALQSALGLSKSFSTSDVADVADLQDSDYWPTDNEEILMPRSASELAINKLRIDSDVLLMSTTMQGRLGNASRSLSTCVVVGDMASTSQLPSPSRYSSSLQNNSAPPAFSTTELVRSVNKKVRQNYIQRRLLITYKTLERLSHSEFNLEKTPAGSNSNLSSDQQQQKLSLPDRDNHASANSNAAGAASKYLCVPRISGKPLLCPDDIAVSADTLKRYQTKTFTRYDRNMFIVNWLDNIDPQQNTTAED